MFLLSDSDLKQQMPFHSPPRVPALYIYPTTQGIFIISASGKDTFILCDYDIIYYYIILYYVLLFSITWGQGYRMVDRDLYRY